MRPPVGQDGLLLFDAAVEVLEGEDQGGRVIGGVVLFGPIVPTDCEHTHVEPVSETIQPWN